MQGGFVKIHRKITEWEWYTDANTFRLFMHCLFRANHKGMKYRGVLIERGQFTTSVRKLAEELKLTQKQIRVALNHLKTTNELAIKTTNQFTLINVNNYAKYQSCDDEKGKQNGKQQDNPRANEGQTKGKHNKNEKNIKKYIYSPEFEKFWEEYPRKIAKKEAAKSFEKYSVDDVLLQRMISSIRRQKQSKQWQEKKYIPYPATWLNQERWEDETETSGYQAEIIEVEKGAFQIV